MLRRRQIDLGIISLSELASPEIIRRENFVWVANSSRPSILDRPILPLALSAPATLDYRAACDVMEASNRRYRVAFASNSLAGLTAIARSGHAISVFTRTAVPPDLFVVTDGMPALPTIGLAVEFGESRPSLIAKLSPNISARLFLACSAFDNIKRDGRASSSLRLQDATFRASPIGSPAAIDPADTV